MLEVLVFVLIVVVIIAVVAFFAARDSFSADSLLVRISSAKDRLSIAQRRFMQGKIKERVYNALAGDIEEEIASSELSLFRLKKSRTVSVGDKVEKVLAVLHKPTNRHRSKINSILKETELIRHEMGLLESKLMRREIAENVFEKMIAKKESQLITKEKELSDLVSEKTNPNFRN